MSSNQTMTSAKHKLPWSKSKFPPDKIARFLLDASKGNLNSEWKAYCKSFSQLVTARSIELPTIDLPINNFATQLRNNDADHNKVYLTGLFKTLKVKKLSPKFTLSDLRNYVGQLIEELNREQLDRLNYQRKKKRSQSSKQDVPLHGSENIPSQRIVHKSKKPKYATRINLGQIAEYLFAVCGNKPCTFAKEARKQLSHLIVSRQMELGTITESPSLTSLNDDKGHNQKLLKSIFTSIGINTNPAKLSITDFLKLVARVNDEVYQAPSKRKQIRR
jgi:hypothetical protein